MAFIARHALGISLVASVMAGLLVAPTAGARVAAPPQAGVPDLGTMALGVAELPRGAKVDSEGYVPVKGTVAYYDRSFSFSRRAMARTGLVFVDSNVTLFKSERRASAIFATVRDALGTTRGRRELARAVAVELGLPARRVKVTKARAVQVKDAAFTLSLSVVVRRRTIRVQLGFVRVDRAFAQLTTAGLGRPAAFNRRTLRLLAANGQDLRTGLSPVSTSLPTIQGTAQVGAVLTGAAGAWSPATAPTSFA